MKEARIWNRRPALFTLLVQSVLATLVAFGADLTGEQVGAIMALTSSALALLTGQPVPPPPPPPAR